MNLKFHRVQTVSVSMAVINENSLGYSCSIKLFDWVAYSVFLKYYHSNMINAIFLEVFKIRISYQYVSNIVKSILQKVFILSQNFCFKIPKSTFSYKGIIVFPIERV